MLKCLQFRRLVTAIQNIALTLNRHYPARLYRLYLVDAPAIVHIPVRVSSGNHHVQLEAGLSSSTHVIQSQGRAPQLLRNERQRAHRCDCVQAIKAMLHPSTSSKILICDLGDERLPVDLAQDSALHQDGRI